jgi:putative tryptophan/tyrosine transport system substrate-binding protein
MRRRDLIALLGSAMTQWSFAAHAQKGDQVRHIGILAESPLKPFDTLRQRLSELGWNEEQNVRFVYRWTEGDDTRNPALAAELVALKVDVIVTLGTPSAFAAKEATGTIPIVMGAVGTLDTGVVSSLAHPAGNITGFSSQNFEIAGKHIGLLRDLIPGIARVAMLSNAINPGTVIGVKHAEAAAKTAGLILDNVQYRDAADLATALPALSALHPDAALVIADTLLLARKQRVVDFMMASRLPAIYAYPEFAEAGGLVSYSPDFDELLRQAAGYVDGILRGTKPGDLPVQQAAKFKLVVNLKTAEAIGITVPPLILAAADEVIE